MSPMEFTKKGIILSRELSELDRFTLKFIKILRKHSPYALVSGYVSILLGRGRASEDVDILIPRMPPDKFRMLVEDLRKHKFTCLNTGSVDEMHEYLTEGVPLRFMENGQTIPNMELKWAKNRIDNLTLKKAVTVILGREELRISPLELQIAFKEKVLKSPKDMEDAEHLRMVAKGHLDEGLLKAYGMMLDEFY